MEPADIIAPAMAIASPLKEHALQKRQDNIIGTCSLDDLVNLYEELPATCRQELESFGLGGLDFSNAAAVRQLYGTICRSDCANALARFYSGCGIGELSQALAVICGTNENGGRCYDIVPQLFPLISEILARCPATASSCSSTCEASVQDLRDLGCCTNYLTYDIITEVTGESFLLRYEMCGIDPPRSTCRITTVNSAGALKIGYVASGLMLFAAALF